MSIYYNEIDPFAAAWLRELIKAGHIAPGEVDERSITEVHPDDLKVYTQCHFFAGIGVWSYALRLAGWPDDRPVWTGSCPCPSFSSAGKGAGFNDPRHLWPDWYRLIRECRPAILFGEQVNAAIGHGWLDLVQSDLEAAEYAVGKAVLGACSVGAPHIRQRLYFVAESLRESCQRRTRELLGAETPCDSQRFKDGRGTDGHSDGSEAGRVADAEWRRCEQRDAGEWRIQEPDAGCEDGRMDNPASPRCNPARQESEGEVRNETRQCGPESGRATGELGVAASDGRGEGRAESGGIEGRLDAAQLGGNVIVGHAESIRLQGSAEGGVDAQGRKAPQRPAGFSGGGLNGPDRIGTQRTSFWRDAEWLWCRDGKYRPVEPGTFPLAHGSANRVGRLRGYGNAIVPQVAQAFIEAYMGVDND